MTAGSDTVGEGWDAWGSRPAPPEQPCDCVVQSPVQPSTHCTSDCTVDCTVTAIRLIGTAGGSGTSTVAAALALVARSMLATELVADDPAQMAAVLGVTVTTEFPAEIRPNLNLARESTGRAELTIIDDGRLGDTWTASVARTAGERRIGVLRGPCYLALRALLARDHGLDGLILLPEPGRALTARDVVDVTGLGVVAVVPVTPAVARSIDAGLLTDRITRHREFRPLRAWLTRQLDPFPPSPTPDPTSAPPNPDMTGTDLLLPPVAEVAGRRSP